MQIAAEEPNIAFLTNWPSVRYKNRKRVAKGMIVPLRGSFVSCPPSSLFFCPKWMYKFDRKKREKLSTILRADLIRDIQNWLYETSFWTWQLISKYIFWMIAGSMQNTIKYRQKRFDLLGCISFHSKSKNLYIHLVSKMTSAKFLCTKEIGVKSGSQAWREREQMMQHPAKWLYLLRNRTTFWF